MGKLDLSIAYRADIINKKERFRKHIRKRQRKLFIKCNDILLSERIKKTSAEEDNLCDGLFFVSVVHFLKAIQE